MFNFRLRLANIKTGFIFCCGAEALILLLYLLQPRCEKFAVRGGVFINTRKVRRSNERPDATTMPIYSPSGKSFGVKLKTDDQSSSGCRRLCAVLNPTIIINATTDRRGQVRTSTVIPDRRTMVCAAPYPASGSRRSADSHMILQTILLGPLSTVITSFRSQVVLPTSFDFASIIIFTNKVPNIDQSGMPIACLDIVFAMYSACDCERSY